MAMIKELYKHKMKQRREEMRSRAEKHQKEQNRIEKLKEAKRKVRKKEIYRKMGLQQKDNERKQDN